MPVPILKTGWLLRESSILKRWKRNWFVLYGDGNLAYFKDDKLFEREGNFSIPLSCSTVKLALECNVNPPEDRNYGCLLKLVSQTSDSLVLAAFNSDEALAWKLMIEQFIRTHQPPAVHRPVSTSRVTRYTTYPNTTTTVYQTNSYPSTSANYPVQQNVPVYQYPNYGPVQVQFDAYGRPYYIHPHTQVVTIVRDDDPYYRRSGDMMLGLAAGAMVGAALYTPFLFF